MENKKESRRRQIFLTSDGVDFSQDMKSIFEEHLSQL